MSPSSCYGAPGMVVVVRDAARHSRESWSAGAEPAFARIARSILVRLRLVWAEQFDPVPKRVTGVEAVEAWQGCILIRGKTRGHQPIPECGEVVAGEGNVRFRCRGERLGHTQVNLQVAGAEPCAAALPEVLRLRNLLEAQEFTVERPGLVLPPGGHGDLDMVNGWRRQPGSFR